MKKKSLVFWKVIFLLILNTNSDVFGQEISSNSNMFPLTFGTNFILSDDFRSESCVNYSNNKSGADKRGLKAILTLAPKINPQVKAKSIELPEVDNNDNSSLDIPVQKKLIHNYEVIIEYKDKLIPCKCQVLFNLGGSIMGM